MRVEIKDFPRDSNGVFGNLRQELVNALHRADTSEHSAKLLASTLGTAAAKLRKIYKEDGIESKSAKSKRLRAERAAKKKAEASTAKLVKEAKAKLRKAKML